jgi:hypothetical protein
MPQAWNMRLVLGIATLLGRGRSGDRVWPVLPGGPRLSSRPSASPDAGVPGAVGGRASDEFLTRSVARSGRYARADFMGGRARDANVGYPDRGLWASYDAPRLELGTVRMGLSAGMVPGDRPRETAGNCRTPLGQGTCRCDTADRQAAYEFCERQGRRAKATRFRTG